jgi:hypothetical protein
VTSDLDIYRTASVLGREHSDQAALVWRASGPTASWNPAILTDAGFRL